ncbi:MAG: hypothetical protein JO121_17030 [Deltaproteobacteria bacterium]|nr:hypothetical protein [Deltaproteobacteria bacterium]
MTTSCLPNKIRAMVRHAPFISRILLAMWLANLAGCGVFYQAGTRIKASHMSDQLKQGESMSEVHRQFGEPSLRQYPSDTTEVWSYAYKPNSNDITAALLYTSTKEGDKGTFLDLRFTDGKLISWAEAEHTMPAKERSGFGAGINGSAIMGPGNTSGQTSHY